MPKEGKNLRKYNSGEISLRFANTFYLDLECILVKQDSCENNPNRTYTEKKNKRKKACACRICTRSLFFDKNKNIQYTGKSPMHESKKANN